MSAKPKLLVVMPNMNMGGTQRSVVSFLKGGQLSDFEVTLLVTDSRDGMLDGEVPGDVRFIRGMDYYALLRHDSKTLRGEIGALIRRCDFRGLLFKLRQVLYFKLFRRSHPEEVTWRLVGRRVPAFTEEFDICIAYMQGTTSYFVIEKLPNVRFKILEFNTDFMRAGYDVAFNEPFFQAADAVVAVSEATRAQLVDLFPGLAPKVHYIPHALDLPAASRGDSGRPDGAFAEDVRRFAGLKLVSVGRLEMLAKGYDLLLRTAGILRRQGIDFRWWFVGDGASRDAITQEIVTQGLEDRVILTGAVVDPFPMMLEADVFVHGSRFEGVPRAVREAMALGIPVVTTNYPSAVEGFRDGFDCLIVEMDAEALAEAVGRLAHDPSLRQMLSSHAASAVSGNEPTYEGLLLDALRSEFN